MLTFVLKVDDILIIEANVVLNYLSIDYIRFWASRDKAESNLFIVVLLTVGVSQTLAPRKSLE